MWLHLSRAPEVQQVGGRFVSLAGSASVFQSGCAMQESPRSRLPFTTVPVMPVPVTVTARAWRARPCVTVRTAGRPRAVLAAGTARGPGPPPPPPAAALAPATQCKQSQGVQRVEKINGYLLQDHFQVLPLFQHMLICHLPHLMINRQVRASS